jgi:uncharacterized protein (TIGR02594 family)
LGIYFGMRSFLLTVKKLPTKKYKYCGGLMNKLYTVLGAIVFLQGCAWSTTTVATADPVIAAQPFIGLEERANRQELKQLMSIDPVRYEWCAAFVNAILELEHIPNLNDIEHPHPLLARAFLQWGEPVEKENIQRGDVVVFPRGTAGWQGHVGFYVETVVEDGEEYWVILGGNQDQSVSYALYNPRSSLGVRRWIED